MGDTGAMVKRPRPGSVALPTSNRRDQYPAASVGVEEAACVDIFGAADHPDHGSSRLFPVTRRGLGQSQDSAGPTNSAGFRAFWGMSGACLAPFRLAPKSCPV